MSSTSFWTVNLTRNFITIYKFALLTGLILTNSVFATEIVSTQNQLTIAAINNQKELFSVRELHNMGASGVQEIDYVVNCSNQTLALSGFALMTEKGRLISNEPATQSASLAFYKPVIDHGQKITNSACNNLVTMNSSTPK